MPESGLGDGFFSTWYLNGERSFGTLDMTEMAFPTLCKPLTAPVLADIFGEMVGYVLEGLVGTGSTALRTTFVAGPSLKVVITMVSMQPIQHPEISSLAPSILMVTGYLTFCQTGDTERDGGFVWKDEDGPY